MEFEIISTPLCDWNKVKHDDLLVYDPLKIESKLSLAQLEEIIFAYKNLKEWLLRLVRMAPLLSLSRPFRLVVILFR